MNTPDIEATAERMYNRYKTFTRAIDAALDHRQSYDRHSPQYAFWDAVISKLKAARKSLGI